MADPDRGRTNLSEKLLGVAQPGPLLTATACDLDETIIRRLRERVVFWVAPGLNLHPMNDRDIQIAAHKLLGLRGHRAIELVLRRIDHAGEIGDDRAVLLWGRVFDVIDAHERDQSGATRH
jgi:hypothetical protein